MFLKTLAVCVCVFKGGGLFFCLFLNKYFLDYCICMQAVETAVINCFSLWEVT